MLLWAKVKNRDSPGDDCIPITNCQWFIPNAFTPDDNTINESWYPVCSCPETEYRLTIFNRWGEEIFTGVENGQWDGTFKGEAVPEGLYFYKLSARHPGQEKSYRSGAIHLLR